ncbi:peptidoglycan editing factor PgeF [Grimontia hollisae]|uniref:peptidoglycan editing factor PgeF n=1 Tax=Grimontia hollisae TaxID=673 RepID=UPI0002E20819|nr:peptidoglycan editing factor PgeF [Grimontia hollisae]AMG30083.1 peptidoglycan editing factor PgeF [Grimontia hollisae]STO42713.1 Laccase domain protein yfiH [Grimontia hollisae]
MDWITPNWLAPTWIKAVSTTRKGGVSHAPFDSLNLGDHVGDDKDRVAANRQILMDTMSMPTSPAWLNQVHGTDVVTLPLPSGAVPDADASFTDVHGQVCIVMTADCLPVLFCNEEGTQVAAAHAGWRGLVNGVLEQTLSKFDEPGKVMAWLGPAIGPDAFEVGSEVREQFMAHDANAVVAFKPHNDRWLADIYLLARQRLMASGVTQIYGGEYCTVSAPETFFSYRRENRTGRQASCIWISTECG